MSTAEYATIATPAGPFTVMVGREAVLAAGWTASTAELTPQIHPALRPDELVGRADLGPFTAAASAYHDGDVLAVDGIPVHQLSGAFLTQAWDVLRTVPAGAPISYAEFAAKAGRPEAIRAAANACARNAAALFVPCHRVLRSGGTLGGFRWGLPVKQWLLEHEAGR